MKLRAGTSGYSYKEWKGSFYPEGTAASAMLRAYAEQLPAVEINNTFYRLPRASVLETWADQVPEAFRFVIKASRRITHQKRLREVEDETGYLFETLQVLGPALGAVLFQLPPNLKRDDERLDRFLELLPPRVPVAIEFRNASWLEDAVMERLRARNCALVFADTDESETDPELPATASFGYVRLRREAYDDDALDAWAERLRRQPWDESFIFFKHEADAAGPLMARAFLDRFAG